MAKKIYDDGMSAELRYYYRNKEKINAKKAAARAANPEHFSALRAARKDKENEQKREYRARNKEKIAAYFADNKERFSAAKKEKYQRERDSLRADSRRRYAEDPSEIKQKVKAWADANPEKIKAMGRAWRAANPDKARLQGSAKRARKRGATGRVSSDIADRLMVMQKGKCACCRVSLKETNYHVDHVVPLALGGMHDDSNLQLLCPPCNLSKHAKHPIDFMQSRGFLL